VHDQPALTTLALAGTVRAAEPHTPDRGAMQYLQRRLRRQLPDQRRVLRAEDAAVSAERRPRPCTPSSAKPMALIERRSFIALASTLSGQMASWKRRRRTGDALPRRAQAVVEEGKKLIKEAKGLGRGLR
jgi:hypothetical protein